MDHEQTEAMAPEQDERTLQQQLAESLIAVIGVDAALVIAGSNHWAGVRREVALFAAAQTRRAA